MLKVMPIEKIEQPAVKPITGTGWIEVVLGTLPPESIQAVESLNNNRKFSFELGRERVYGYALDSAEVAEYSHLDRLAVAMRSIKSKPQGLTIEVKPVGVRAKEVLESLERGTASFEVLVDSRSKTDVSGATSAVVIVRDDVLSASFK